MAGNVIKIYHSPKTRSLRAIWMLEEMGLPYEAVPMPFPAAGDRAYRQINPLGTLPAMVDGPAVITESVGIVDYLARRYGPTPLAPEPDDPTFAAYIQFLHLGEGGLSGPLTYLLRARFMAPPEAQSNWSLDDIRKTFARRLRLVTRALADGHYMAGEAFTAADISVGYALLMGRWIGAGDGYDEATQAYVERITTRPAYLRAKAI